MIDDALHVRPRRERGCQCMAGIDIHRPFEHVERVGIAVGIERKHARHGPEREVVGAELAVRLLLGAIDLGKAQARLEGGGDARRKMLARRRVLADGAIRTMRPQVTARVDLDQPQGQPRLPAPSAHDTGETVARRSRLSCDGNAGPRQRGGEFVGNEAGDLGILRTGLDRLQDDGQAIATGGEERRHRGENTGENGLPLQGLGRRFAIAPPVFDRKPPAMRKAAAQREVHHLLIGRALQELAAHAVEADVTKGCVRRLAEKHLELTLKCSRRDTGRGREIDHGPVAADVRAHGIERTPHTARQQVRA